jgi:hypothetical protein
MKRTQETKLAGLTDSQLDLLRIIEDKPFNEPISEEMLRKMASHETISLLINRGLITVYRSKVELL